MNARARHMAVELTRTSAAQVTAHFPGDPDSALRLALTRERALDLCAAVLTSSASGYETEPVSARQFVGKAMFAAMRDDRRGIARPPRTQEKERDSQVLVIRRQDPVQEPVRVEQLDAQLALDQIERSSLDDTTKAILRGADAVHEVAASVGLTPEAARARLFRARHSKMLTSARARCGINDSDQE